MPRKRNNQQSDVSDAECLLVNDNQTEMNEAQDLIQTLRERLCAVEVENASLVQIVQESQNSNAEEKEKLRNDFERHIRDKDESLQGMREEISHLRDTAELRDGELRRLHAHREARKYDVPPPQQVLFYGNTSYVAFMRQFENLSQECRWDDREKAFRLLSSLRGQAADFVFEQVSGEKQKSFAQLETALQGRFQERRSTASFLAELENQKLQSREKLVEYVADIKRLVRNGYPTADDLTTSTICLRYFIKGLGDSHMALTIGMKDPKTIEEARDLLETYFSLKDETKNPKVRVVGLQDEFVTESQFSKFRKEITDSIDSKFEEVLKTLKSKDFEKNQPRKNYKKRNLSEVECYKCHNFGHYSRNCPENKGEEFSQEN